MVKSMWWQTLNQLLYPPHCVGCGHVGALLCAQCWLQVEPSVVARFPITNPEKRPWSLHALYVYQRPVSALIQAYKYQGVQDAVVDLGRLMYLGIPAWPITLCTSVPLHSHKLKARGFNQAEGLAHSLCQQTGWPYQNCLVKTIPTKPQATLTKTQRLTHYPPSTFITTTAVSGQTILLVDDVVTTGATLVASAKALLQAGAAAVYGVGLAHSD